MAIITEVSKLRPELLNMSVAELERRRVEIDMAILEIAKKEEAAARAANVAEAGTRIERLVDDVTWLHDNSFLPRALVDALTRSDGRFVPGLKLRKPKAEDETPRSRDPNAPKRRRRTKAEMAAG